MLTGRRFELRTSTLAIDGVDGKRITVTVPAKSIIKVVSGPHGGDRLVDVLWDGRVVAMFAIDIAERGTEIPDRNVNA